MKKILLALLLLVPGCFFEESGDEVDPIQGNGTIEVVSWDQSYYDSFDEYSMVTVDFKVTNNGDTDIDYYEVWFQVDTIDGSKYQDWTNGLNVIVGATIHDFTIVDTFGKQATNVSITKIEF